MEPLEFTVDKMTYDAANRLCVSDSNLIQETLAVAEGQGLRNHFYRKYARVYDSISDGQSFHQYQVKAMMDCLTREIVRTHKTSFLFEPLGSFDLDKEPYISLTTEEYSDFISFVFCNKGLIPYTRGPGILVCSSQCISKWSKICLYNFDNFLTG